MEYHADRFADCSLLFYEGDSLMALLPANRDNDAVRSHAGLTFGGFVTDARMTSHKMLDIMAITLDHYRRAGARRFVYSPVPHIYHLAPAEEDLYALFRAGARLIRRDLSSVIELAQRIRENKGRRAGIKRALAMGNTLESSDDWAMFMELEEEMLRERYNATPTHTAAELELLASRFPDSIRLFVVRRESRVVAGTVIYETPVVAHTQYIGVSPKGRAAGALDVLVSGLLEEVYADKRYFDFGISTEQDGKHLNAGLVRNKESYGARSTSYDRYEIVL